MGLRYTVILTGNFLLLFISVVKALTHRNEITFFVENGEKFCFSEDFDNVLNYTVQYKVLRGQNIDFECKSPEGKLLNAAKESVGHVFTFFSSPGYFSFCFTNVFTSLVKKKIYLRIEPTAIYSMKLKFSRNKKVMGPGGPMETSCEKLFKHLENVRQGQQKFRLRSDSGRYFAEELNYKVICLSLMTTSGMFFVGLGQVFFLKRLFDEGPVRGKYFGILNPFRLFKRL